MKRFFKDYKVMCGEGLKFYKNHWKGTLVLSTVGGIAAFAIYAGIENLKDTVEIRRCKKKLYEGLNEEE